MIVQGGGRGGNSDVGTCGRGGGGNSSDTSIIAGVGVCEGGAGDASVGGGEGVSATVVGGGGGERVGYWSSGDGSPYHTSMQA